jgi:hypothetical protein
MGGFFRKRPAPDLPTAMPGHPVSPQLGGGPTLGGGNDPRDYGLQTRSVREAIEVLHESLPGGIPGANLLLDAYGFRSLGKSVRDINEVARLNELNRAEWGARYNPMLNRGIAIRTDLVVSEGFTLEAECEDAELLTEEQLDTYKEAMQRVLDDYWERNEWEDRLYERVRDVGLTGEGVRRLPKTALDVNGETEKFRPGFFRGAAVLPHYVQAVHVDPWDAERLVRLTLRPGMFNAATAQELELKILCRDYYGATAGRITGDVNFLAVNRQVGQSRGTSDLVTALDWVDLHDQMLVNDNERLLEATKYLFSITLENADDAAIKKYANELKKIKMKAATKHVHGPEEKWELLTPNLNLGESHDLSEATFEYGWGALGLPKGWYVDAEYASTASAHQQAAPAYQWSRTRRRQIMGWILLEARYALQVAAEAGRLDVPYRHLGCKLISRDPNRDQYEPAANALKGIADAFTTAIAGGFANVKDAQKVFREFAGGFGLELMTPEEAEQAAGGPPENPVEQVMKEARAALERHRPRLQNGRAHGAEELCSSSL